MLNKLRSGFSLLELLLAMVLFATIVVFMATLWGQHAHIIGKARNRMTAAFIAEQVTEQYITLGYKAAISSAISTPTGTFNVTTVMRGQPIVTPYNYTVHVAPANPSGPNPLTAIVKVMVYFPDEQDNATFKGILYETYLAKPTN